MNKELKDLMDEQVAKMLEAGVPGEKELRESKVPRFGTLEELSAYIKSLVERPHSYGTCVYAMSLAATAAFNFVAGQLGVTGFQASCADLDILARTRGFKWGRLLNFEDLLYPQYCNEERFPSVQSLMKEFANELAEKAKEKLAETEMAHPNVRAHWEMLAAGGEQ